MNLKRIIFSTVAFLALAIPGVGWAQFRPPELTVAERVEKPVLLDEVHITTEIAGSLAMTTVEMKFFNPNSRVLEGSLNFPLLEAQSVVRFAMDMNGTLREAVPVEKAKGQQVFEEIVRRGIDPGLIEKTEGNNYRVRVYPIPANGYKRLVVGVLEVLTPSEGGARYRLPLSYPGTLKKFSLKLSVQGPETKPIVVQNTVAGLELPDWREQFTTGVEKTDFKAEGLLELAVPLANRPQAYTQRLDDKTYFYSEVAIPTDAQARPQPKVLGILWDSSASGAARDHAREFELLEALFSRLAAVEVRLVRVRNAAEEAQVFKVQTGDWSALKKALQETIYDGATALGNFRPDAAVDEYLLFSDGLSNFGVRAFPEIKVPLHSVLSASKADPAYLRYLAEHTGGEFVNLISEAAKDVALRLMQVRPQVLGVDSNPAEVAHVFTRTISPASGLIAVAGVLRTPSAAITIRYGISRAKEQSILLDLSADRNPSQLVGRAWAQLKIAALEPNYAENRADILRTGEEFGIVTRETSLIILDRVDDYVRYNITPPPEMRAEFDAISSRQRETRNKAMSDHLETVVQLFQNKLEWWNRDFPKDTPREKVDFKAKGREEAEREDSVRIGGSNALHEMRAPSEQGTVLNRFADAAAPGAAPAQMAQSGAARSEMPSKMIVASRGGTDVSVQLQKWSPTAAYLDHFKRVPSEKLYQAYLEERPEYARSTAFFLDVADFFMEKGQKELALRILSNLAEMDLENHQVLRILGYRLLQMGLSELAIPVFEKVLEIRPEEPQSYRDLGLACAAGEQYQRAVDMLWEVVSRAWDGRFSEIELIALSELNAIAAAHPGKADLSRVDVRLRKNLPLDVRAILTWDADSTDIDLWVTDPNGEKCMYNHALTYQGGRMSHDFTGGYGPEEFGLRVAKPGKYLVEANYYGNRQQIVSGATTIQLTLSAKYGTEHQKDQTITLRLKDKKEVVRVGEFEVK